MHNQGRNWDLNKTCLCWVLNPCQVTFKIVKHRVFKLKDKIFPTYSVTNLIRAFSLGL
jgi:hypothetical protein